MNANEINQALITGQIDRRGVLPHVDSLKNVAVVFDQEFGLEELPTEPGAIFIRGARQYGKSTWLEQQTQHSIKIFGNGSALYLNGDEIQNNDGLYHLIKETIELFSPKAPVKRLFIDEITAISNWQKAIKRIMDEGELKEILLITTGSKASDLRRGFERFPGRKGKLARTHYIFTPVSYEQFKQKCYRVFQKDTMYAYLLSGGSPIAINALIETQTIPEYITSIVSDWILGEFAASGRSRSHLLAVLQSLYRMATTPIGQAKLARESGLTNNTVAQGYIELLSDLMCIMPSFPFDMDKQISIFRKPCKYHFCNLLVAMTRHPKRPRTVKGLKALGSDLGAVLEWAVSQEIWRRVCINSGNDVPEHQNFWQFKTYEVDFILPEGAQFIEVKSGKSSAREFGWFTRSFPKVSLTRSL